MNPDDANALAMVERGYNESSRVLNFRVRFADPTAALEAIESIGGYNAFDGAKVAAALSEALATSTYRHLAIEVGREGSPVIYLTTYGDKPPRELVEACRATYADEVSFAKHTVRAWWD